MLNDLFIPFITFGNKGLNNKNIHLFYLFIHIYKFFEENNF